MTGLLLALSLAWADEPLSFVVFVADDQRADSLWAMDRVQARLVDQGTEFTRAYATTPLCCPARASLLSGGHTSASTGVFANARPNGCTARFPDTDTLATRFQAAGYATGLVGKYLNDYPEVLAPTVPPGWTSFAAITEIPGWFHFDVVYGSSTPTQPGQGVATRLDTYVTDWQGQAAVSFLQEHGQGDFLLLVSLQAPHPPQMPAPEDEGAFSDHEHRPPSFDEEDVSDKPGWVQDTPRFSQEELDHLDQVVADQLACLLSVDRAVAEVLDTLEEIGAAERTVVVYTSDNGTQWGEHRQQEKGRPYEESVRVPLVVRHPERPGAGQVEALVASDLDLAATLMALAGVQGSTEGLDLSPWLAGQQPETWRDHVVIANHARTFFPSWAALVTLDEKLVSYTSSEVEYYDLEADPWEIDSLHLQEAERVEALSRVLDAERPLDVLPIDARARVGQPLQLQLDAIGGEPPYTWEPRAGWPEALELSAEGVVTGTSTQAHWLSLPLRVHDASTSPWHGGPQELELTLDLQVQEAEDEGCGCRGESAWMLLLLPVVGRRRRPSR